MFLLGLWFIVTFPRPDKFPLACHPYLVGRCCLLHLLVCWTNYQILIKYRTLYSLIYVYIIRHIISFIICASGTRTINIVYIYMLLRPLHTQHMSPRERQLAHEEAVRESQSWGLWWWFHFCFQRAFPDLDGGTIYWKPFQILWNTKNHNLHPFNIRNHGFQPCSLEASVMLGTNHSCSMSRFNVHKWFFYIN